MAIVYQHRRIDTGEIFYIGIAEVSSRPYDTKQRSRFWREYTGKHLYQVEILAQDIEWEEACLLERDLISRYGRRDLNQGPLVNMTEGGEGRPGVRSEQEKIKHRGWKHTPESIEKIKQARRARSMPPKTDEQKRVISERLKGIKRGARSKEHTEKIASKRRGISTGPRSEEVRQAISNGRKGLVYARQECPQCKKMIPVNGSNYKRHVHKCTLNS
jgi:hypothetical protein